MISFVIAKCSILINSVTMFGYGSITQVKNVLDRNSLMKTISPQSYNLFEFKDFFLRDLLSYH